MKRIILRKDNRTVVASDLHDGDGIIATYTPDSTGDNHVYFLTGDKFEKNYNFTNLYGQNLGAVFYETIADAIAHRMDGSDCCCEPSEVYLFKNMKEVVEKFGG